MSKFTGQPNPPAHTVGGACQPPSQRGGFTPGIVWCCDTCKGLWYATEYEWKYLSGSREIWEQGERGKDALVPWEAIDKLRAAYPSDPGAYMTPVDHFLREVVGDR